MELSGNSNKRFNIIEGANGVNKHNECYIWCFFEKEYKDITRSYPLNKSVIKKMNNEIQSVEVKLILNRKRVKYIT